MKTTEELTALFRERGLRVTPQRQAIFGLLHGDDPTHVDANIVMLHPARFVEVQGTGEHASFSRAQLEALLDLAETGIGELFAAQRQALGW